MTFVKSANQPYPLATPAAAAPSRQAPVLGEEDDIGVLRLEHHEDCHVPLSRALLSGGRREQGHEQQERRQQQQGERRERREEPMLVERGRNRRRPLHHLNFAGACVGCWAGQQAARQGGAPFIVGADPRCLVRATAALENCEGLERGTKKATRANWQTGLLTIFPPWLP